MEFLWIIVVGILVWVAARKEQPLYLVTWINEQYEDTYEFFSSREEAEDFISVHGENCYGLYDAILIRKL